MPTVRTRRWRRSEYDRLAESGFFGPDERLELLDGALVVREPQGPPHAVAVELAGEALRAAFGPGWSVRVQLPVALDDLSEPEPDIAVVRGAPRDRLAAHPSRPGLVVEVTESTLAFDREVKGALYARAGLPEYWIVNLADRVLEVYREPVASPAGEYGYRSVTLLRAGAIVSPLAAPAARIAIASLLP